MITTLRKIKLDITTYLLLVLALFSGYIKTAAILLIIVFVHELGHIFFFSFFHIPVESIIIYPFGGVSKINKRLHERIYKDVLCAMGGILFQIVFFLFIYFLFSKNLIVLSTYMTFKNLNRNIIIFNLLPLIPLDGSKVLFSIFTKFFSYKKSYILLFLTSFITLILFFIYNFVYCIQDIVIYIFLLWNLYLFFFNYPFIMNKFYLERILYDHYYDKVCNTEDLNDLKLTKFYFFKEGTKYTNEKKFIKNWMRNRCK